MAFDYVAFLLLLQYVGLFGVGCHQLSVASKSRNKRLTIRNGIVSILTSATLLRIIFWLKACVPTTISSRTGLFLFFLPVFLFFAGLSLLVVFYAQAITRQSKKQHIPMRVFVLVNSLLLVCNLVIAGELDGEDTPESVKAEMLVAYAVYGSLLDFTLAILLGYYGRQFKRASSTNVLSTRILPNSLVIFDRVNTVIIAAYLFRGTFTALLSSGKVFPQGEGSVQFNGEHPVTSSTTFFFFFVAEIVPCVCVLGLLWKVAASTQSKHHHGVQHHIDSLQRHADGSTLDARLLSVEDSKVKIFITAAADGEEGNYNAAAAAGGAGNNNKTASIEADEDDEGASYLLFEDTHKAAALLPSPPPGPLPIPTHAAAAAASSSTPSPPPAHSFDPSPAGSFSKFWGSSFFKPPTPGSREPTPDLPPVYYSSLHESGEAYGNTLSPRDILLHAERRRSLKQPTARAQPPAIPAPPAN